MFTVSLMGVSDTRSSATSWRMVSSNKLGLFLYALLLLSYCLNTKPTQSCLTIEQHKIEETELPKIDAIEAF